jgi:hypothetical protein
MRDDLMALFDDINELLSAPSSGAEAPALAHVEHTLTTGYARALALEAERWRLERRLGELAAASDDGPCALERADLADRLAEAARELAQLRNVLEPLRSRASALRVAAATV